jgi:hypothetical protein
MPSGSIAALMLRIRSTAPAPGSAPNLMRDNFRFEGPSNAFSVVPAIAVRRTASLRSPVAVRKNGVASLARSRSKERRRFARP